MEDRAGKEKTASPVKTATASRLRKTRKLPTIQTIREELEQASIAEGARKEEWMQLEEPYTEEQLREQWDVFLATLKEANKEVEYATLNRNLEVQNGMITLEFENGVQSIILERLQQELVGFLRKALKNKNINISAHVKQAEGEKKVYTNKEKFEYLSEKYPSLRLLRSKLDLDTDF